MVGAGPTLRPDPRYVAGQCTGGGWQGTRGRAPAPRATAFEPLPLGSIKPAGWLKDQLRIQADGLSGHLDEFWPDIKDSAWFGGKAEGWERVPYWLDGIVPLAYMLDDPALKAKVKKSDRLHPRSPARRRLARARGRQPEAQALRRLAACSPSSRRSRNTRRRPAIRGSSPHS